MKVTYAFFALLFLGLISLSTAHAISSSNYELESLVERKTQSSYRLKGYLGPSGETTSSSYNLDGNVAFYSNQYPASMNFRTTTLYDSRDESAPSGDGTWFRETLKLNGFGWYSNEPISVLITRPDGTSTEQFDIQANENGEFVEYPIYDLDLEEEGDGGESYVFTIWVITDGGLSVVQYDTFTFVDTAAPEFPFGSSLATVAAGAIYLIMGRRWDGGQNNGKR
jgi:hypothetical protein